MGCLVKTRPKDMAWALVWLPRHTDAVAARRPITIVCSHLPWLLLALAVYMVWYVRHVRIRCIVVSADTTETL